MQNYPIGKELTLKLKPKSQQKLSAFEDTWTDPEGGTGGLDPPGKSQVVWVSIGNKKLDPVPPGKCWTSPRKMLDHPLEPWKMTVFFESNHLTSISQGQKQNKKNIVRAPGSAHGSAAMFRWLFNEKCGPRSCLSVSSADNLCKQFVCLMVFLKEISKILSFKKKSADDRKAFKIKKSISNACFV